MRSCYQIENSISLIHPPAHPKPCRTPSKYPHLRTQTRKTVFLNTTTKRHSLPHGAGKSTSFSGYIHSISQLLTLEPIIITISFRWNADHDNNCSLSSLTHYPPQRKSLSTPERHSSSLPTISIFITYSRPHLRPYTPIRQNPYAFGSANPLRLQILQSPSHPSLNRDQQPRRSTRYCYYCNHYPRARRYCSLPHRYYTLLTPHSHSLTHYHCHCTRTHRYCSATRPPLSADIRLLPIVRYYHTCLPLLYSQHSLDRSTPTHYYLISSPPALPTTITTHSPRVFTFLFNFPLWKCTYGTFHLRSPHSQTQYWLHARLQLPSPVTMTTLPTAPTLSLLTPTHYEATKTADIRFGGNSVLPSSFNPDPTTFETRQFHGTVLLPHAEDGSPPIHHGDTIDIALHFYASGAFICYTSAVVRHIQLIANPRLGKLGDQWSIYSGSTEHGSTNRSAYILFMEASIPTFPNEVLWFFILAYKNTGAAAFLHPFPFHMAGDALMIFNIQFPPGLNPHTLLQLGDKLKITLNDLLIECNADEPTAVDTFTSSLFVMLTPAISKTIGGHRVALLATDTPTDSILRILPTLPHKFPDWSHPSSLMGAIPTTFSQIELGGHLPAPSSFRDADYLPSTIATYFLLPPNCPLQPFIETLAVLLRPSIAPHSDSVSWIHSRTIPTTNGLVHVAIAPTLRGHIPPPARAMTTYVRSGDTTIPCVTVFNRADVAYDFHLPKVTVGGYYNHLPLKSCSSPSTAMLSYHLGRPPLEALYLLSIYDCASAVTSILTSMPPPPTSAPPQIQPVVPRKGRQPVYRQPPVKHKGLTPSVKSGSSTPTSHTSSSLDSSTSVSTDILTRMETNLNHLITRVTYLESVVNPHNHNQANATHQDTLSPAFKSIGNLISLPFTLPIPPHPFQIFPLPRIDAQSLHKSERLQDAIPSRPHQTGRRTSPVILRSKLVSQLKSVSTMTTHNNLHQVFKPIISNHTHLLRTLYPVPIHLQHSLQNQLPLLSPLRPHLQLRCNHQPPHNTHTLTHTHSPQSKVHINYTPTFHNITSSIHNTSHPHSYDPSTHLTFPLTTKPLTYPTSNLPFTLNAPQYSPRTPTPTTHPTLRQLLPHSPRKYPVDGSNATHLTTTPTNSHPNFATQSTSYLHPDTLPHIQMVIITLNSHKKIFHSPFSNTTTIHDLLTLTFAPPIHLPAQYRLTYNNATISPRYKVNHLPDPISEIHIILPILGGNKTTLSPTHSTSYHPLPHHDRPQRYNPTRPGFTIRLATLNCNGFFKNNPDNRHQLLWDFIHTNKIDVLFLIDHRTAPRSLERIRNLGCKHLQMDIRLITTDITCLYKHKPHSDPSYNYHATVGGCAIMTFGSLAHITFPTQFKDPSGAGTFIGAKIQTHPALPPIFLNALYLFPPSRGSTTLNSRIESYLREQHLTDSPPQWQRNIITSMLQEQYDAHPDCSQIVGGDFNHRQWSDPSHPTTRTFIHDLQLTNTAFLAHASSCDEIPQPITYIPRATWIDHILHIGRTEVTDFRDYRHSLVTTYTDHAPYSNDIYIHVPTQHYNIPKNTFTKAQTLLKATHIRKHDTIAYKRFQNTCTKYLSRFIPETTTTWTALEHEQHYEYICNSLVDIAKASTK